MRGNTGYPRGKKDYNRSFFFSSYESLSIQYAADALLKKGQIDITIYNALCEYAKNVSNGYEY